MGDDLKNFDNQRISPFDPVNPEEDHSQLLLFPEISSLPASDGNCSPRKL